MEDGEIEQALVLLAVVGAQEMHHDHGAGLAGLKLVDPLLRQRDAFQFEARGIGRTPPFEPVAPVDLGPDG
jgi:hypothetical protein